MGSCGLFGFNSTPINNDKNKDTKINASVEADEKIIEQ